jgi:hypothetical protein
MEPVVFLLILDSESHLGLRRRFLTRNISVATVARLCVVKNWWRTEQFDVVRNESDFYRPRANGK